VGEAVGTGPEVPRPALAESEHGDQRVVQPPELTVAVEGHAIPSVAVLSHGDGAELDAIAAVERSVELGQHGVGGTPVDASRRSDARLLDPVVVAPQPARSPRAPLEQRYVGGVGTGQPSSGHVDPGPIVEPDALEVDLIDDGGRGEQCHGGRRYRRRTSYERSGDAEPVSIRIG
jgi:hypothetical protein